MNTTNSYAAGNAKFHKAQNTHGFPDRPTAAPRLKN